MYPRPQRHSAISDMNLFHWDLTSTQSLKVMISPSSSQVNLGFNTFSDYWKSEDKWFKDSRNERMYAVTGHSEDNGT